MILRGFFILIMLIGISGCATLVDYNPQPISDVKDALLAIERSINLNPIKKGVMLDSADERMMKLIGALQGGAIQQIILFKDIDYLTLHTKRDRFSVSIYGAGDTLQFRFYFNDRYSATRLIDALYTMKDHVVHSDGYQYSIKYGEEVRKIKLASNFAVDDSPKIDADREVAEIVCHNRPEYSETTCVMDPTGTYEIELYPDGSGRLARPGQRATVGDRFLWEFQAKKDVMTDEVSVVASRHGANVKDQDEPGEVGVLLVMTKPAALCVIGHDFPGKTAEIRVDDNRMIETSKNGCIALYSSLEDQLRNGKELKVRGYKWPHKVRHVASVDLDGYGALVDYLRSKFPAVVK